MNDDFLLVQSLFKRKVVKRARLDPALVEPQDGGKKYTEFSLKHLRRLLLRLPIWTPLPASEFLNGQTLDSIVPSRGMAALRRTAGKTTSRGPPLTGVRELTGAAAGSTGGSVDWSAA